MRKVLENILIEVGIPMKLVRPIKMCLNQTHRKVHTGKHLSDPFPIQNGLKKWRCFISTAFQLCFRICIRRIEENQEELEVNGTYQYQFLFCAENVNMVGENINTINKNTNYIRG
jgi:hypothetical protein